MASCDIFGLDKEIAWDTSSAYQHLLNLGVVETKRTAERRLHELNILPEELRIETLSDQNGRGVIKKVLKWETEKAKNRRELVLFIQIHALPTGKLCLHANDARGARYWVPYSSSLGHALASLQAHIDKKLFLVPHKELTQLINVIPPIEGISFTKFSYPASLNIPKQEAIKKDINSHLSRLEAESIYIIREAVAEAENPAMLYSIGKDSSVMLHLARKAFYPAPLPLPLLHVDTRWKFQEMYLFRDYIVQETGTNLITYINPTAIEKNINPFDHGSALHTDITKTEGLKQALDKYKYDVVFGGARRDEEKSRAKERIFSFRSKDHIWDPKNQRPELWSLFNTKKRSGESIRVFPLSNWTELDVWQYIQREQIPIVPLYFAKERPVVIRNDMIIMIDDDRMPLMPDEEIKSLQVRFRTLGCYPLTGAIESNAKNVQEIIEELLVSRNSERQGRAIDSDSSSSMEKKKKEGYF